jgi:hypothetical protein
MRSRNRLGWPIQVNGNSSLELDPSAGMVMTGRTPPKPRLSMTGWIYLLTAGPLVIGGGLALLALSLHPDNENDTAAAGTLARVAPAVEQALVLEGDHLERLGAVIAGDPKFFAVLNLPKADRTRADFKNALENVMREFQKDADTPFFEVLDERGALLGRALKPATEIADLSEAPFVRSALIGRPSQGYLVEKGNVYRVATVPVTAGGPILGVLCLGRSVDSELAERLKTAMASEVVFVVSDEIHGPIAASQDPRAARDRAKPRRRGQGEGYSHRAHLPRGRRRDQRGGRAFCRAPGNAPRSFDRGRNRVRSRAPAHPGRIAARQHPERASLRRGNRPPAGARGRHGHRLLGPQRPPPRGGGAPGGAEAAP